MLTVAKYYASALFLTAVFFITALDTPEALSAMLSKVAADDPDRIKNVALLLRTWLNYSALLALVGFALRLVFPWPLPGVGRRSMKALPGHRAGAVD